MQHHHHDVIQAFKEAMQQRGIIPPEEVIADGKIHRCDVEGKGGKNDGSYKLYLDDNPAGGFENHRDCQEWENWSYGVKREFTPAEREAYRRKVEAERKTRETERLQRQYAVAAEEQTAWSKMPEGGESPYLTRKQVSPYGIRFDGDMLVIPMRDARATLWACQRIAPDGSKRFTKDGRKKGCFHIIGELQGAASTYVAEGYSTAASIYQATGRPVIVAFDAGNLEPVIAEIRKAYPDLLLTICADDDVWTDGNPGKTKAEEAARKHGCNVILPQFQERHAERRPTDFNDLHVLEGIETVKAQLEEKAQETIETPGTGDAETIARLAALPPLEYDREAKAAAKALGVTRSAIDAAVKEYRAPAKASENGSSELFPMVETWPEAVSGDALLQELASTFRRYAVLPAHADTALALWVCFTWLIDAVKVAPILAICSPEKQCGKTTVLTLVNLLVARALTTSNISPAALFRAMEAWQPTMLIDEADTFIRDSDELRGVINSGHTRATAFVIRTVGEEHEPKRFSTWGAKAIALIGKLPDTLHDRSIVIELRRKLTGEKTEKLRYSGGDGFIQLQRKLQRFADDSREALRLLRPNLPEGISDRAADNWEPLLAIAILAGGCWPEKALTAALALSARDNDATSLGTELLADMEALYNSKGIAYLYTSDLIEALCKEDERPWATYNRGRPITPRQIAKLLKEYGIHSKNIKSSYGSVQKGYERSQFTDAFSRYLSHPPENIRYPLPEAGTNGFSVADAEAVAATKTANATPKASETAAGSGRTDNLGGAGGMVEVTL